MEEAPSKMKNAAASLTEDLILKILRRFPASSLFHCKLVCHDWKCLISDSNNHDKLPQTVAAGFFYDSGSCNRHFTSVNGLCSPSLEFLPFMKEFAAVSDCCNGLILCWCLRLDGYRYVICNPMTKNFVILPPSTHDVGHDVGEARLAFDPIASSHFNVTEYVDGEDALCAGVEIYSSETAAWIYKESEWDESTDVTMVRAQSVFLNGCLHISGFSDEDLKILAMDMEEKTWRKIDRPGGCQHSMHQAQGHLCLCLVDGPNYSKLSIWILEDYGTNNWTLKQTVTTLEVFRSNDIGFDEDYIVITVHPEWNLIYFAGEERTVIAYDMDHREVHEVLALVLQYGRRLVKREFFYRPYYLSFVPLLSDLLAEQ